MKRLGNLTAAFVRTVDRPGVYGDGRGGRGLSLRVHRTKAGRISKTWRQRLRIGGRLTSVGLGPYPEITLTEARRQALDNSRTVRNGGDPRGRGGQDRGRPGPRESQDRGVGVVGASVRAGSVEMLDRERLATRLGVPMRGIAAFCDRWGVEELALFGSVLRDDFGPDSDIDVLVRFKPGRTPGLFVAARIRSELADMLRRRVDLVHRPTIERSRNYIRRKKILESARVVYAT